MTNEEYKKQFERLELDDQNSKGCSITLAEWLNNRNVNIIYDFITQALDEVRRESVGDFARWWNGKRIDNEDMQEVINKAGIVYGIRTPEVEEYLAKKGVKDATKEKMYALEKQADVLRKALDEKFKGTTPKDLEDVLKPYNPVIQVCPVCGKIDVYKGDGHSCDAYLARQVNQDMDSDS